MCPAGRIALGYLGSGVALWLVGRLAIDAEGAWRRPSFRAR